MYISPGLSRDVACGLHRNAAFGAKYDGNAYAQPLYWEIEGKGVVVVATEHNEVIGFNPVTGAQVWKKSLGAPVPKSMLGCGNIDPLGVTGTPIIDPVTKTLYVAAMTQSTDAQGVKKPTHKVFALSLDDGSTRSGWPVDISSVSAGGVTFNSRDQNQRGALALLDGKVYVPYGGHYGDCGDYHGWVVGIPAVGKPKGTPSAYVTPAKEGGIWAPGGVVSDGHSLYVATGNTDGATAWGGGEAVIRLQPGPKFSGNAKDFFTPENWKDLDDSDVDIGGTAPLLIKVAGNKPEEMAVALGKDGKAYVIDRANLGGVGHQLGAQGSDGKPASCPVPLAVKQVSSGQIINAAATYTTEKGTFVVFRGVGMGCPAGQAAISRRSRLALGIRRPRSTSPGVRKKMEKARPSLPPPTGLTILSYGLSGRKRIIGCMRSMPRRARRSVRIAG